MFMLELTDSEDQMLASDDQDGGTRCLGWRSAVDLKSWSSFKWWTYSVSILCEDLGRCVGICIYIHRLRLLCMPKAARQQWGSTTCWSRVSHETVALGPRSGLVHCPSAEPCVNCLRVRHWKPRDHLTLVRFFGTLARFTPFLTFPRIYLSPVPLFSSSQTCFLGHDIRCCPIRGFRHSAAG